MDCASRQEDCLGDGYLRAGEADAGRGVEKERGVVRGVGEEDSMSGLTWA